MKESKSNEPKQKPDFNPDDSCLAIDEEELGYLDEKDDIPDNPGVKPTSKKDGGPVSGTEKPKRWWLIPLGLIVASAIVVFALGYMQRNDMIQLLARAVKTEPPSITMLDSRADRILMLEQLHNLSWVVVQRADLSGWQVVSGDDTTATNPVLSPSGEQVAYCSQKNIGQIVIASLITNTQQIISTDLVAQQGQNNNLPDLLICPWSPLAWDSNGHQLAFLGCNKDRTYSILLVADITKTVITLKIIPDSKAYTPNPREVKWLTIRQIIVTKPNANATQLPSVITYDIP